MADSRFFSDHKIGMEILTLIEEARENLYLVSPYNNFAGHLTTTLSDALRRRVSITFLHRKDQEKEKNDKKAIDWLRGQKVTLVAVEKLHAKIYLSEKAALLTSMNLLEHSMLNSCEVGVRFSKNDPEYHELKKYINTLIERAAPTPVPPPPRQSTPRQPQQSGYCIRCMTAIFLNPAKPFCPYCYDIWAQWENPDYTEKYCHECGREHSTSMNKPACPDCYRKSQAASGSGRRRS